MSDRFPIPARRKRWAAGLSVLLLSSGMLLPETPGSADYDVLKAVYLERLSRFVEWPASTGLDDISSDFVIAVMGRDRFIPELKKLFSSQPIRKKRVRIVLNEIRGIEACHILFIAASEAPRLAEIIARVRNSPVLTVADSPGFAEAGVQINLYRAGNRIRFEINEQAVRDAGLQIGYQLLSFARIVHPVREIP
jgi:hypothetical protein